LGCKGKARIIAATAVNEQTARGSGRGQSGESDVAILTELAAPGTRSA
jgi:hypothetical protein